MKSPISFYDAQGVVFGAFMMSMSVVFLKQTGLVTGQTAGLSLLLSYVLPFSFGTVFFCVSLPFLWLSLVRRGVNFTLRTLFVVAGVALCTPMLSELIVIERIHPLFGAALGGSCAGVGLIALFRHNASAGGLGILALVVEEKTGFKTGWFQMGFDSLIFLGACFVLAPDQILYSFVGAVILNAIIAWNFKIAQSASMSD
ncbi:YitT family protein [Nisaea sp.]|uniref:YitT family protein n=1 Tax=Nisaea sp. TaxID=2024842 RepID=UPI003264D2FE